MPRYLVRNSPEQDLPIALFFYISVISRAAILSALYVASADGGSVPPVSIRTQIQQGEHKLLSKIGNTHSDRTGE
jgi:hypothetical protein